jgi:hypothetical protein
MENSKQGARAAIEKASGSFLKKKPKNFDHAGAHLSGKPRPSGKSFLVLFFKKEPLA